MWLRKSGMTLTMVRTQCCQSYKCTGTRCEICPNRPENKENVLRYQQESKLVSVGRRLPTPPANTGATA